MKPTLLIYADFESQRLLYILRWIFEEQLGVAFELTTERNTWTSFEGPKLNYSTTSFKSEKELQIIPHPLLQESGIQQQQLSVNRWKHSTILFYNQPGAKVPFDLFAAAFYLITRYEEYLPHSKDKHARYNPEQSVAAQYSFLQQPVVDEWIFHFVKILEQYFQLQLPKKQFQFIPTYDIDIAWKYLHKGAKRKWAGLFKDTLTLHWQEVAKRLSVLSGKRKDPFDAFDWLDEIHKKHSLHPIYFLLLALEISPYDKNADPHLPAMQSLVKTLSDRYEVGIHPSYLSNTQPQLLNKEIQVLSDATSNRITKSRQHYIKLSIPETYQKLIAAGIEADYSMGYPSVNGFRAGTCNSFNWYHLNEEAITTLRVHPFAFMEATNKFYLKQSTHQAWQECERLLHAVKKVNGTFISIWHNYTLGTDKASKGWPELYLKILQQLL